MSEIHKFWSPDLLVWTGCIEKMMKCTQSGAWVPVSKYLINLNHLSTLPHLPSFQNGLSEHVPIISSHFLNENVRAVERSPLIECIMSFVQYFQSNQGGLVPRFGVFQSFKPFLTIIQLFYFPKWAQRSLGYY